MRVINFYRAALVTQKLINISYGISCDIKVSRITRRMEVKRTRNYGIKDTGS